MKNILANILQYTEVEMMLYFTFVSDFTETMKGSKFVCNSDFFILESILKKREIQLYSFWIWFDIN